MEPVHPLLRRDPAAGDARIQQIWLEETRKHGVDQKMDKFFPAKA